MNGELLQGRNSLCNNGLMLPAKNLPEVPNTLVTLTLPYRLVTFRLEALRFLAFNVDGEWHAGPFPEVT
jgi:hypothetical protein